MKIKYLFLSIVAASFLSSAISAEKTPSIGDDAPAIETISGNILEKGEPGKNRIVTFWSLSDPASRIQNAKLAEKQGEDTQLITICLDNEPVLASAAQRMDGVNPDVVLTKDDISAEVIKDYGISKSGKSFLIDAAGKIKEIY